MNKIRQYFLKADPWQLCLMMTAPYGVYKFTGFGHDPVDWGILVFYFLIVALGWIYSVGIASNQSLDIRYRINPAVFAFAIAVPIVCLFIFLFMVIVPLHNGEISRPPGWAIWVNFAAVVSFAYSVWYAAKQFSTVQLRQETRFLDYYVTFMCLWFGFIGVWFLQPKIKRQFADEG